MGAIKISDEETRFQISAGKAQAYAEKIARTGSGEKGVSITPVGQTPRAEQPAEAPFDKGKPKKKPYKAKSWDKPKRKPKG